MDERVPFLQNLPTDNGRAELLCCCKGLRQLFNRGDLRCCSCSLFTKIRECLGGGDERRRCCCIEVLEKVRECFTTGFNKKDGSSTKNKGKKVVVPDDGPPITDDSFFLLTGLETSSTKLYLEHKALREEVDDHIKEVAMKFGMIMAVATTGSLGVGAVTCSVALEMAGLYCVFLWIILSFVVFIGWNRISGCHSRLKAKIGEQDELIVRLDEMKNAFKKSHQFQSSTFSEGNPEKVREFHTRLGASIGTTKADIRDCLCLTYVLVVLLNIAGYMHCALMSFILYKGVCPGEKAPVPSPHIL